MINFNEITDKWQDRWEKAHIFRAEEKHDKKKCYILEMYPYPSSTGLHMGHARNYCIGDSYVRFKRMQGFNVLYPMGYDSFGLPAENAAIKFKIHPKQFTEQAIDYFIKQQKGLGLSYDWDRMIMSHDPFYYKWNQWIFLKFLEKGLAFKKKSFVNWCPNCNTVLANEQVHDGKCWRCKSEVDQKELDQWFFRITEYAQELLENIDKLEHWPERVKIMQKNWIGRSEGVTLKFDVVDSNGKKVDEIETYTTRVDTVYGITYLVLAAEHPKVIEWTKGTKIEKEVKKFISDVKKQTVIERTAEGKEKNGIFLGKWFINPFTNEKCPLWVADYALYDYGTGAVMAVPTHDQRDFEFAKKYKLPMKVVISPHDFELNVDKMTRAFVEDGIMVNSNDFNGMSNTDAMEDIAKLAEKKKWGKKTVNFKLKDWLISRQRYWGTPIPVIYCDKCGMVPVDYDELPVKLPKNVKFTGKGNPLETSKEFVNVKCPKCDGKARRETDTMDTFVDSSWYFLRYCSPKYEKAPFDSGAVKYWMPVDQYIGGIEHACMHLIYARFFTKALRDMKMHNIDEPFTRLLCQGMVLKDGEVMSKSKGNVVDPREIIEKYGADTARTFILFVALPEKELEWSDEGVAGVHRFLNRVYNLISKPKFSSKKSDRDKAIVGKMSRVIQKVTSMIDDFKLSLAIGSIMEYVNDLYKYREQEVNEAVYNDAVKNLALLISPFAPHLAEEMWEKLKGKGFISLAKWPEYDESKIDLKAEAGEDMLHNTISDINSVLKLLKIEKPSRITLIVAEKWKYEFFVNLKKVLEETRNVGEVIKKVIVKEHGKEISSLVPRLVKDVTKIPDTITSQDYELKVLKNNMDFIIDEFEAPVEIVKAEDSKENKAKNAMPGKVAILVQ